ncbi:MAG: hypothetical protein AB7N65_03615 [Vicinamibacterales bacterium]
MHITMIKKRLADGSECRKCQEATSLLKARGLWHRVDDIVWAEENDPASPGMLESQRVGAERAPFFVVRDESGESVYASVLQLISQRFAGPVSTSEQAGAIDPDDIGGI